jgi:hypothetical protein
MGMRHTIRLLACFSAGVALLATSPAHASAARPRAASLWPAPSQLYSEAIHYQDLTGYVDAHRFGTGQSGTSVCLYFWKRTPLRDGTVRSDAITGCQTEPKQSAYAFDAVRWKGVVSVGVPVERVSYVENPDGTNSRMTRTSREVAWVKLRWAGVGQAAIDNEVGTTLALTTPVHLVLGTRKHAFVDGTLKIGADAIPVNHVAGVMENGGHLQ